MGSKNELDPEQTIRRIHTMGENLGFERVRTDRQQLGGLPHQPKGWFEVGFGCGEVTVRHSIADLHNGRWSQAVERFDFDGLLTVLELVAERGRK